MTSPSLIGGLLPCHSVLRLGTPPEYDTAVGIWWFGVGERLDTLRRGKEQPFSSADEFDVGPFTGVAR
jgi:hypothetical protein